MNLFGEKFQAGVLMDPITAIVGGISAVTSIIGGKKKSDAAKSAAQLQAEAAAAAGKKVTDATERVNPDILNAATGANKLLDPYAKAGSTAAGVLDRGIAEGGDFNKTPTMADLQIDPGYAFRRDQSIEALTRSAAAHGGVGGGGFVKDLNNQVQGGASQEFQKAFERFETATQNRFANVSGVAGIGMRAAEDQGANTIGAVNTTSGNTINAAHTSADYDTQAANAQAAGKVASSNAMWGGLEQAGGTALATSVLARRPANNYIINPNGPGGLPLSRPNRLETVLGLPGRKV